MSKTKRIEVEEGKWVDLDLEPGDVIVVKPKREWYIEFHGNPYIDDKENYKRYVGAEKFTGIGPGAEVIHVIEYGKVEELEAKLKVTTDALAGVLNGSYRGGTDWHRVQERYLIQVQQALAKISDTNEPRAKEKE